MVEVVVQVARLALVQAPTISSFSLGRRSYTGRSLDSCIILLAQSVVLGAGRRPDGLQGSLSTLALDTGRIL